MADENNVIILATCRSEMEYKKAKNTMQEKNIDLETIFSQNLIELGRVSSETGKDITKKVGINWDNVNFDGTIGSVFMQLGEMEKRFGQEDEEG